MTQLLKRLWPEERGENVSEYGLLLLLMSLVALAGMRGLATGVNRAYAKASTQMINVDGANDIITTDAIGDVYTNQVNRPATPQPAASPSAAPVSVKVKTQTVKSQH